MKTKISTSTIVRTLLLLIVIINLILKQFGISPIQATESELLIYTETIIEIAIVIAAWWYNNSFSKKALKAQQFLEDLREE